jgi:hypothetical protein
MPTKVDLTAIARTLNGTWDCLDCALPPLVPGNDEWTGGPAFRVFPSGSGTVGSIKAHVRKKPLLTKEGKVFFLDIPLL